MRLILLDRDNNVAGEGDISSLTWSPLSWSDYNFTFSNQQALEISVRGGEYYFPLGFIVRNSRDFIVAHGVISTGLPQLDSIKGGEKLYIRPGDLRI